MKSKHQLRLAISIFFFLLVAVGAFASFFLSQQSQDIRQQASRPDETYGSIQNNLSDFLRPPVEESTEGSIIEEPVAVVELEEGAVDPESEESKKGILATSFEGSRPTSESSCGSIWMNDFCYMPGDELAGDVIVVDSGRYDYAYFEKKEVYESADFEAETVSSGNIGTSSSLGKDCGGKGMVVNGVCYSYGSNVNGYLVMPERSSNCNNSTKNYCYAHLKKVETEYNAWEEAVANYEETGSTSSLEELYRETYGIDFSVGGLYNPNASNAEALKAEVLLLALTSSDILKSEAEKKNESLEESLLVEGLSEDDKKDKQKQIDFNQQLIDDPNLVIRYQLLDQITTTTAQNATLKRAYQEIVSSLEESEEEDLEETAIDKFKELFGYDPIEKYGDYEGILEALNIDPELIRERRRVLEINERLRVRNELFAEAAEDQAREIEEHNRMVEEHNEMVAVMTAIQDELGVERVNELEEALANYSSGRQSLEELVRIAFGESSTRYLGSMSSDQLVALVYEKLGYNEDFAQDYTEGLVSARKNNILLNRYFSTGDINALKESVVSGMSLSEITGGGVSNDAEFLLKEVYGDKEGEENYKEYVLPGLLADAMVNFAENPDQLEALCRKTLGDDCKLNYGDPSINNVPALKDFFRAVYREDSDAEINIKATRLSQQLFEEGREEKKDNIWDIVAIKIIAGLSGGGYSPDSILEAEEEAYVALAISTQATEIFSPENTYEFASLESVRSDIPDFLYGETLGNALMYDDIFDRTYDSGNLTDSIALTAYQIATQAFGVQSTTENIATNYAKMMQLGYTGPANTLLADIALQSAQNLGGNYSESLGMDYQSANNFHYLRQGVGVSDETMAEVYGIDVDDYISFQTDDEIIRSKKELNWEVVEKVVAPVAAIAVLPITLAVGAPLTTAITLLSSSFSLMQGAEQRARALELDRTVIVRDINDSSNGTNIAATELVETLGITYDEALKQVETQSADLKKQSNIMLASSATAGLTGVTGIINSVVGTANTVTTAAGLVSRVGGIALGGYTTVTAGTQAYSTFTELDVVNMELESDELSYLERQDLLAEKDQLTKSAWASAATSFVSAGGVLGGGFSFAKNPTGAITGADLFVDSLSLPIGATVDMYNVSQSCFNSNAPVDKKACDNAWIGLAIGIAQDVSQISSSYQASVGLRNSKSAEYVHSVRLYDAEINRLVDLGVNRNDSQTRSLLEIIDLRSTKVAEALGFNPKLKLELDLGNLIVGMGGYKNISAPDIIKIADSEFATDPASLAKQKRAIGVYEEIKKIDSQLMERLSDGTQEITRLAQEEIDSLQRQRSELTEELKTALSDPKIKAASGLSEQNKQMLALAEADVVSKLHEQAKVVVGADSGDGEDGATEKKQKIVADDGADADDKKVIVGGSEEDSTPPRTGLGVVVSRVRSSISGVIDSIFQRSPSSGVTDEVKTDDLVKQESDSSSNVADGVKTDSPIKQEFDSSKLEPTKDAYNNLAETKKAVEGLDADIAAIERQIKEAEASMSSGETQISKQSISNKIDSLRETQAERIDLRDQMSQIVRDQESKISKDILPVEVRKKLEGGSVQSKKKLVEEVRAERLSEIGSLELTREQESLVNKLLDIRSKMFDPYSKKLEPDVFNQESQKYNEALSELNKSVLGESPKLENYQKLNKVGGFLKEFSALDAVDRVIAENKENPGIGDAQKISEILSSREPSIVASSDDVLLATRLEVMIRDAEFRSGVSEGVPLFNATNQQVSAILKHLTHERVATEVVTGGGKTFIGAVVLDAKIELFGKSAGLALARDGQEADIQEAIAKASGISIGEVVIVDSTRLSEELYVFSLLNAKKMVSNLHNVLSIRNYANNYEGPNRKVVQAVYKKLTTNLGISIDEVQMLVNPNKSSIISMGDSTEKIPEASKWSAISVGKAIEQELMVGKEWGLGKYDFLKTQTKNGADISDFSPDALDKIFTNLAKQIGVDADVYKKLASDTELLRGLEATRNIEGQDGLKTELANKKINLTVEQAEKMLDQVDMVTVYAQSFKVPKDTGFKRMIDGVLANNGGLTRKITVPASDGQASEGQSFSQKQQASMEYIGAKSVGQEPNYEGLTASPNLSFKSDMADFLGDLDNSSVGAMTGAFANSRGVIETSYGMTTYRNSESVDKIFDKITTETGGELSADRSWKVHADNIVDSVGYLFRDGHMERSADKSSNGNARITLGHDGVMATSKLVSELGKSKIYDFSKKQFIVQDDNGKKYTLMTVDKNGEIVKLRENMSTKDAQKMFQDDPKDLILIIGRAGATGDSIATGDNIPGIPILHDSSPEGLGAQAVARSNRIMGEKADQYGIIVSDIAKKINISNIEKTSFLKDTKMSQDQFKEFRKSINLAQIDAEKALTTQSLDKGVVSASTSVLSHLARNAKDPAVQAWASKKLLDLTNSPAAKNFNLTSGDSESIDVRRKKVAALGAEWKKLMNADENKSFLRIIEAEEGSSFLRMQANAEADAKKLTYAKFNETKNKEAVVTARNLSEYIENHSRYVTADSESRYVADSGRPPQTEQIATSGQQRSVDGGEAAVKTNKTAEDLKTTVEDLKDLSTTAINPIRLVTAATRYVRAANSLASLPQELSTFVDDLRIQQRDEVRLYNEQLAELERLKEEIAEKDKDQGGGMEEVTASVDLDRKVEALENSLSEVGAGIKVGKWWSDRQIARESAADRKQLAQQKQAEREKEEAEKKVVEEEAAAKLAEAEAAAAKLAQEEEERLVEEESIVSSERENLYTLGRDDSSDFVAQVGTVSRNHAQVLRDKAGSLFIKDLGSKYGTLVNGEAITSNAEVRLKEGDVIKLGSKNSIQASLEVVSINGSLTIRSLDFIEADFEKYSGNKFLARVEGEKNIFVNSSGDKLSLINPTTKEKTDLEKGERISLDQGYLIEVSNENEDERSWFVIDKEGVTKSFSIRPSGESADELIASEGYLSRPDGTLRFDPDKVGKTSSLEIVSDGQVLSILHFSEHFNFPGGSKSIFKSKKNKTNDYAAYMAWSMFSAESVLGKKNTSQQEVLLVSKKAAPRSYARGGNFIASFNNDQPLNDVLGVIAHEHTHNVLGSTPLYDFTEGIAMYVQKIVGRYEETDFYNFAQGFSQIESYNEYARLLRSGEGISATGIQNMSTNKGIQGAIEWSYFSGYYLVKAVMETQGEEAMAKFMAAYDQSNSNYRLLDSDLSLSRYLSGEKIRNRDAIKELLANFFEKKEVDIITSKQRELIESAPFLEVMEKVEGVTYLGRHLSNHFTTKNASVSRVHALVGQDILGTLYITDLGSLTGTYVNGKEIDTNHRLGVGDVIVLGNDTKDTPAVLRVIEKSEVNQYGVEVASQELEIVSGVESGFKSSAELKVEEEVEQVRIAQLNATFDIFVQLFSPVITTFPQSLTLNMFDQKLADIEFLIELATNNDFSEIGNDTNFLKILQDLAKDFASAKQEHKVLLKEARSLFVDGRDNDPGGLLVGDLRIWIEARKMLRGEVKGTTFENSCSSCAEVRDQTRDGLVESDSLWADSQEQFKLATAKLAESEFLRSSGSIDKAKELKVEAKNLEKEAEKLKRQALDRIDQTKKEVVNSHGMQNQCVQLYLNAWVDTREAEIRQTRTSVNKAIDSVYKATVIAEGLLSSDKMNVIVRKGFLGIGKKEDSVDLTASDKVEIREMLEGNDEKGLLGLREMAEFEGDGGGEIDKKDLKGGVLSPLKESTRIRFSLPNIFNLFNFGKNNLTTGDFSISRSSLSSINQKTEGLVRGSKEYRSEQTQKAKQAEAEAGTQQTIETWQEKDALLERSHPIYDQLNEITRRIYPEGEYTIYVSLDDKIGAFTIPSTKTIFLTVGLVKNLNDFLESKGRQIDEGHLAFILGHELSHWDEGGAAMRLSETYADVNGFEMSSNAGYNTDVLLEASEFLTYLDKMQQNKSGEEVDPESWKTPGITHPASENRKVLLQIINEDLNHELKGRGAEKSPFNTDVLGDFLEKGDQWSAREESREKISSVSDFKNELKKSKSLSQIIESSVSYKRYAKARSAKILAGSSKAYGRLLLVEALRKEFGFNSSGLTGEGLFLQFKENQGLVLTESEKDIGEELKLTGYKYGRSGDSFEDSHRLINEILLDESIENPIAILLGESTELQDKYPQLADVKFDKFFRSIVGSLNSWKGAKGGNIERFSVLGLEGLVDGKSISESILDDAGDSSNENRKLVLDKLKIALADSVKNTDTNNLSKLIDKLDEEEYESEKIDQLIESRILAVVTLGSKSLARVWTDVVAGSVFSQSMIEPFGVSAVVKEHVRAMSSEDILLMASKHLSFTQGGSKLGSIFGRSREFEILSNSLSNLFEYYVTDHPEFLPNIDRFLSSNLMTMEVSYDNVLIPKDGGKAEKVRVDLQETVLGDWRKEMFKNNPEHYDINDKSPFKSILWTIKDRELLKKILLSAKGDRERVLQGLVVNDLIRNDKTFAEELIKLGIEERVLSADEILELVSVFGDIDLFDKYKMYYEASNTSSFYENSFEKFKELVENKGKDNWSLLTDFIEVGGVVGLDEDVDSSRPKSTYFELHTVDSDFYQQAEKNPDQAIALVERILDKVENHSSNYIKHEIDGMLSVASQLLLSTQGYHNRFSPAIKNNNHTKMIEILKEIPQSRRRDYYLALVMDSDIDDNSLIAEVLKMFSPSFYEGFEYSNDEGKMVSLTVPSPITSLSLDPKMGGKLTNLFLLNRNKNIFGASVWPFFNKVDSLLDGEMSVLDKLNQSAEFFISPGLVRDYAIEKALVVAKSEIRSMSQSDRENILKLAYDLSSAKGKTRVVVASQLIQMEFKKLKTKGKLTYQSGINIIDGYLSARSGGKDDMIKWLINETTTTAHQIKEAEEKLLGYSYQPNSPESSLNAAKTEALSETIRSMDRIDLVHLMTLMVDMGASARTDESLASSFNDFARDNLKRSLVGKKLYRDYHEFWGFGSERNQPEGFSKRYDRSEEENEFSITVEEFDQYYPAMKDYLLSKYDENYESDGSKESLPKHYGYNLDKGFRSKEVVTQLLTPPKLNAILKAALGRSDVTVLDLNSMFMVATESERRQVILRMSLGENGFFIEENYQEYGKLVLKSFLNLVTKGQGGTQGQEDTQAWDEGSADGLEKVVLAAFDNLTPERRGEVFHNVINLLINSGGTASKEQFIKIGLSSFGVVGAKLGQMDSLFPEAMRSSLQELKEDVPNIPKLTVWRVLEKQNRVYKEGENEADDAIVSLGRSLKSGSTAVVYEAIRKDGKKIIVKVIRPDAKANYREDLAVAEKAMISLGESGVVQVDTTQIMKELNEIIAEELDPTNEEVNVAAMEKSSSNNVLVPKIYAASSDHIEMSIAEGRSLGDIVLEQKAYQISIGQLSFDLLTEVERKTLGVSNEEDLKDWQASSYSKLDLNPIYKKIISEFFDEAFRVGRFHSDLHEGNIFINENIDRSVDVTFIDWGQVGVVESDVGIEIEPSVAKKEALVQFLMGVVTNDSDSVAKSLVNFKDDLRVSALKNDLDAHMKSFQATEGQDNALAQRMHFLNGVTALTAKYEIKGSVIRFTKALINIMPYIQNVSQMPDNYEVKYGNNSIFNWFLSRFANQYKNEIYQMSEFLPLIKPYLNQVVILNIKEVYVDPVLNRILDVVPGESLKISLRNRATNLLDLILERVGVGVNVKNDVVSPEENKITSVVDNNLTPGLLFKDLRTLGFKGFSNWFSNLRNTGVNLNLDKLPVAQIIKKEDLFYKIILNKDGEKSLEEVFAIKQIINFNKYANDLDSFHNEKNPKKLNLANNFEVHTYWSKDKKDIHIYVPSTGERINLSQRKEVVFDNGLILGLDERNELIINWFTSEVKRDTGQSVRVKKGELYLENHLYKNDSFERIFDFKINDIFYGASETEVQIKEDDLVINKSGNSFYLRRDENGFWFFDSKSDYIVVNELRDSVRKKSSLFEESSRVRKDFLLYLSREGHSSLDEADLEKYSLEYGDFNAYVQNLLGIRGYPNMSASAGFQTNLNPTENLTPAAQKNFLVFNFFAESDDEFKAELVELNSKSNESSLNRMKFSLDGFRYKAENEELTGMAEISYIKNLELLISLYESLLKNSSEETSKEIEKVLALFSPEFSEVVTNKIEKIKNYTPFDESTFSESGYFTHPYVSFLGNSFLIDEIDNQMINLLTSKLFSQVKGDDGLDSFEIHFDKVNNFWSNYFEKYDLERPDWFKVVTWNEKETFNYAWQHRASAENTIANAAGSIYLGRAKTLDRDKFEMLLDHEVIHLSYVSDKSPRKRKSEGSFNHEEIVTELLAQMIFKEKLEIPEKNFGFSSYQAGVNELIRVMTEIDQSSKGDVALSLLLKGIIDFGSNEVDDVLFYVEEYYSSSEGLDRNDFQDRLRLHTDEVIRSNHENLPEEANLISIELETVRWKVRDLLLADLGNNLSI